MTHGTAYPDRRFGSPSPWVAPVRAGRIAEPGLRGLRRLVARWVGRFRELPDVLDDEAAPTPRAAAHQLRRQQDLLDARLNARVY